MGMMSAICRELIAAGVTGDALVTAIERIEAASDQRSASAKRQARYRERNASVTRDAEVPPKETSPTPPKEITPSTSLRSKSESAREAAVEFSETFWPEYPHKVGKPKAMAAFRAARKRAPLDRIMFGLRRYVAEKPGGRDWLNPATFLNQDRFDDQPAEPVQPERNGRVSPHTAFLGALAREAEKRSGGGEREPGPDDRGGDFTGLPPPAPGIADELEIPTFLRRQ